jgi:hypothetical protein
MSFTARMMWSTVAKDDRRPAAGERARWRAKLREGQVLASTLVGMDVDSTTRLARQSGFIVEVIISGMSFDRRMDRIRLFTGSHNIVTRATAG